MSDQVGLADIQRVQQSPHAVGDTLDREGLSDRRPGRAGQLRYDQPVVVTEVIA